MSGYADPELLIATWLGTQLGRKVWRDPRLPGDWDYTAPIGHLQRGQDFSDAILSLDFVLLDIDWWAGQAETARLAANETRDVMRLELPLVTLPGGIFVKAVETVSPPTWTATARNFCRSASYRLVLHGFIN